MSEVPDAVAVLGSGQYRYEPVRDWPQIPDDLDFVEAIGVAVGPDDRVYVFNRGGHPVLIFEADGQFVETWGAGEFVRPHGLCAVPDATLYLTDDLGHRVAHYTAEGVLIGNVGPSHTPSETGVQGFDYRCIRCPAGPYNLPTNVAIADDGHLYVSDGYGNAAVHEFAPDGSLVRTWGGPGDGPGEFHVPHGVCVDPLGRVLVADRENSRIQLFSREGIFLEQWDDVVRPCQVFVDHNAIYYVAELGNQNGRFPWQPQPEQPVGGRVSIFDRDGNLLSRWGGGLDARRSDEFYACHDLSVDSAGNIYVGEVAVTAAKAVGEDPAGLPTLRKFKRIQ